MSISLPGVNQFASPPQRFSRRYRPCVDILESRFAPAVALSFVDDTWHLRVDLGAAGLSAGDIVDNRNDVGGDGTIVAEYAIDAFGTVTTGAGIPLGGASLPEADTIDDAIENTVAGGTVNILQGTYTETVVVDKTLTLLGAQAGVDARTRIGVPETILDTPGGSFALQADNIVLDGFTVQGTTGLPLASGIVTSAIFSGYQIVNNIIQDNVIGLYLGSNGAFETRVEQNLIRDNDNPGAAGGTGIYSDQGLVNALIQNNTITGQNPTAGVNLNGMLNSISSVTVTGNAFSTGNQLVVFNVDNSVISSNQFTGSLAGGGTGTAIFIGGGADNLTITANVFIDRGNRAIGALDIGVGVNSNLTITNNTITQDVTLLPSGRAMIDLDGVAGSNLVSGNTVTLSGATNATVLFVHALQIGGATTGAITASANTLNGGNSDTADLSADSAGIRLRGTLPPSADVLILNNIIAGFDAAILADALALGVNVDVNFNDLADNVDAVISGAGEDIDASFNFFGATTAAQVAALVSADVDYTPWLGLSTDTSSTAGFQPSLASLFVDDDSPQVGELGRIEEAFNAIAAGGTLNVLTGTYIETVNLTSKTVTLVPGGSEIGQVTIDGNLILDASNTLALQIDGAVPGVSHDQLDVNGIAIIDGANLALTGTAALGAGTEITIIDNDLAEPVVGTFAGLPEGALVSFGGRTFEISYVGGTGNDVTLTATDILRVFATGPDAGLEPRINVFNTDGTLRFSRLAFGPSFRGGVRVAVGDVNGDGVDDIIAAAGSGRPRVRIFSGDDGRRLAAFLAFDGSFRGGVFVAAGDFDADASLEVVTSAGPGGQPRVRVWDITGSTATLLPGALGDFLAFGPRYRGGVSVAAGDVDGTGLDEIVVGGLSGRARVRAFRTDGTLAANFVAYEPSFRGGVFVAAGDLRGDARAEIIVGPNTGRPPEIRIFSVALGTPGVVTQVDTFFAYGTRFTGGVRVGVADYDLDGQLDILTGPGPGRSPLVRVFDGLTLAELDAFFAYGQSFRGGVFVGGSS